MIKTTKPFIDIQFEFVSNNKRYSLCGGVLYDDECAEVFDLGWTWVSDLTDRELIEKICCLIIHVSSQYYLKGKESGKKELQQEIWKLLGKANI